MPVHWTTYLTALLTPLTAIFVAYIAWQQWRLSRHKLKLDLFEKRWAIYAAANDLLASLVKGDDAERRLRVAEFNRRRQEAQFLCNEVTIAFLDRIDQRRFDLVAAERNLRTTDIGSPDRSGAEERALRESAGCERDYRELIEVFKNELQINF
ncbi:hypothetical protein [Herbaspirillum sp.]|uniref:hypothetical protein n=1 Tax=Herbaspirillum sp. TaxID=1890675 RepID=UPI000C0BAE61|nr:hypothetical protein [Herbaspirillum sp.]MAF04697.1 hypothetical protein [Herbaspirillum sp.]|tara:strand:+ start:14988 stop:15446 length:459 start_codon:yes stop_codon:yes gene_type:complete